MPIGLFVWKMAEWQVSNMRLLNRLTIQNLKENRKRTIMTIVGIVLSVSLITAIANLYVSINNSLITYTKEKTGDFHYGFYNLSQEEIEKLGQNRKIESIVIRDEDVFVRVSSKALREDYVINGADIINSELIELEKGIFHTQNDEVNTLFVSVIIVMCMIIVTSIMCIQSSFDISVSERIRQYGMLASVGTTRAQIRRNVYFEATILALFGIPLGLLLGIGISYVLICTCDSLFKEILVYDLRYSFSSPAAVVAVMLSILTIYLSAIQSANRASKIAPIEAVRNQETVKMDKEELCMPKWIHKNLGIGGEVAYKNLMRSKQKYKTTIVTLVICVSLFIAVSSFIYQGLQLVETNFDKNYNLCVGYNNFERNTDSTLIQYLGRIKEMDGVKRATYTGTNLFFMEDQSSIAIKVIDSASFQEYTKDLELDFNLVKDKGILTNKEDMKNDIVLTGYFQEWISSEIKEENKVIDIPYEIHVVNVKNEVPFGQEEGTTCIVLNMDLYADCISKDYLERIYINASDLNAIETRISKLSEEFVKSEDRFYVENLEENEREARSFYLLVAIFMYSLITVVACVGITNMINIVSANMNLRRREFAVLKSIGMTSKEFHRMILLESIFYSRAALVIGIPCGVGLSYVMYGYSFQDYIPYHIPYAEICISAFLVFLLTIGIMRYEIAKFSKESIIETIRNENI